jgi:hypothetical protein
MSSQTRRGYSPGDERDFTGPALGNLSAAAAELTYLLNRGYPIKGAAVFIGNHRLLTERQRLALARAVSADDAVSSRRARELSCHDIAGKRVNVDGFNTVITLEVALSGSPVLICADGTVRDLAGLRGTYRIIDRTYNAVRLIIDGLVRLGAAGADFLLDAPVSNSGRLKAVIAEAAEETGFDADIEIANYVDKKLSEKPYVITSDSIILDKCRSWFNLNKLILKKLPDIFEVRII